MGTAPSCLRFAVSLLCLLFALLFWELPTVQAQDPSAATLTVTTNIDEFNTDGDCSLREAVIAANTNAPVDACGAGIGADTIIVPSDVYTLTLYDDGSTLGGATGSLDLHEAVTIQGQGTERPTIKWDQFLLPARPTDLLPDASLAPSHIA